MKRSDIDRIRSSLVLLAISWAAIAILSIVLIQQNNDHITQLTQRIKVIEQDCATKDELWVVKWIIRDMAHDINGIERGAVSMPKQFYELGCNGCHGEGR